MLYTEQILLNALRDKHGAPQTGDMQPYSSINVCWTVSLTASRIVELSQR